VTRVSLRSQRRARALAPSRAGRHRLGWLLGMVAAVALMAGCDKSPTDTYIEMVTSAQMGDVDGFLDGFSKSSRKLVEAQIALSEAYGMNDLNPYRLLVFDSVEEEIRADAKTAVGESYVCPKDCAVLNVMTGRRKRKILMLKIDDAWRIDLAALEDFWKQEKKSW